jgi:hypothetical protein
MAKHELYFSKYCKHSSKLLEDLNQLGMGKKFNYISIDKRVVKQNVTYILNPDGTSFPLPPMINRVPVLLLKPNHEILVGDQILEYVKPQIKNINEEKTMLFNEPNPYMFKGAGGIGVVSDEFSFLDSSVSELSAQGNGGMRQMYNYVALDSKPDSMSIPTQFDPDKQPKLSMTLEQLENQRKNI